MQPDVLIKRVSDLIELSKPTGDSVSEPVQLIQGTITVLQSAYGPDSPQEADLKRLVDLIYTDRRPDWQRLGSTLRGVLTNLKEELELGLVGTIRAQATGEVISDLLLLARQTLEEPGAGPKNVASVLAAAAFEDALRRLAASNGLPHIDKLADVHTALKEKKLLQGAQIATAHLISPSGIGLFTHSGIRSTGQWPTA
jgi:hypothetical protein